MNLIKIYFGGNTRSEQFQNNNRKNIETEAESILLTQLYESAQTLQ